MQILVLGAGRAGTALADRLFSMGHDVVLADPDAEKKADLLDDDIVRISGVVFDVDVLKEAGIESADVVCAMTDSQNQNIMAAQIARSVFGIPKVIVRIFETHEQHIFDERGLVSISSPELTVEAFLDEILKSDGEDPVETCECEIMGQRVRFLLLDIEENLLGCRISEIEDTGRRHVFGLIRKDRMVLAYPHLRIEKDDRLVLADA